MGFLDGAKSKLGKLKNIGEETFKNVDSSKLAREEPTEAPRESRKGKKITDLLPKPSQRPADDDLDDLPEYSGDYGDDSLEDEAVALALSMSDDEDSPFDIDEDQDFYQGMKSSASEPQRELGDFEDLPKASSQNAGGGRRGRKGKKNLEEPDEQKIKDVLEVLRIPSTYVIPNDVLMPDDFKEVEFDLQVPQGYDIGQVEFFIERAEGTVKEYLKLLEQRNDHIAILATTVDRLQVDLENIKFDSQIAAGIGIMPTSDSQELEQDNIELQLKVKRLEDALKAKTDVPDLTSRERELYENLRNEFSILKRENEEFRQENSDLRMTIAKMEEDAEDTNWVPDQTASSFSLPDDSDDFGGSATQEQIDGTFNEQIEIMDDGLPDLTASDSGLPKLPDLGELPSLSSGVGSNAPQFDFGGELPEFEDNDDGFTLPGLPNIGDSSSDRSADRASGGHNPFADDDDTDMQLPSGW